MAVTGTLGAALRGASDAGMTAGCEVAVRCDGGAVAGYDRDGMIVRPEAGVSAGPLVPCPLKPPGVVTTIAGACAG